MIRVLQSKDVDTSGKTWYRFSGDSTDSKPTGEYPAGSGHTIANGSRFFENKTEIRYEYKNGSWNPVGQVDVKLIEKTITENGEYNPADDNADGYSSVSVDVEPNLTTKSITTNGEYTASADNADGYSKVTVNVPAPTLTGFDVAYIRPEYNEFAFIGYYSNTPSKIEAVVSNTGAIPQNFTKLGTVYIESGPS